MKTVGEFQKEIISEINDPENKIYLRIKSKAITKESYLADLKRRGLMEGLTEEEIDDVCYLAEKALWGFGVLDFLINNDDTISDIRLMDENNIRVKKQGHRESVPIKFNSRAEYENYIDFITGRNSVNVSISNAAQVFTDKDSSPTNILRFTLASELLNTNDAPTLLIRKIPKKKKTFKQLLSENYLTKEQMDYLVKKWRDGKSILVCGPNGSGKTTFINALLETTPHEKSAVVIQESEELFCDSHPEMVFRKIVPARNNANFYYDLKALGTLALMESFDIMVVGEIKGGEAANLAYATYTGSQCMTSVHSNSAYEGFNKIVDYALAEQPNRTREHFAKQLSSLDTVIYVADYKIKEIVTLKSFDEKTGDFTFEHVDVKGPEDES